jgi:hypothetical protein
MRPRSKLIFAVSALVILGLAWFAVVASTPHRPQAMNPSGGIPPQAILSCNPACTSDAQCPQPPDCCVGGDNICSPVTHHCKCR